MSLKLIALLAVLLLCVSGLTVNHQPRGNGGNGGNGKGNIGGDSEESTESAESVEITEEEDWEGEDEGLMGGL